MLAHGFQTLIQTAPGAGLFPFVTEDSLVGFLEQSSRFLKPVFAGDTLYPALEVDELSPNRTTGVVGLRSTVHNQRRELVLEGRQRFLLRKRPPDFSSLSFARSEATRQSPSQCTTRWRLPSAPLAVTGPSGEAPHDPIDQRRPALAVHHGHRPHRPHAGRRQLPPGAFAGGRRGPRAAARHGAGR